MHRNFSKIPFNEVLDSLFDGIYFVDKMRQITCWNKSAERITGFAAEEVIGSSCADNILRHVDECGQGLCNASCPIAETLLEGSSLETTALMHHKKGHRVPVQIRTHAVRDDNGIIVGAIEVFTYCTGQQMLKSLERSADEALVDPLTRLGNRRYGEMAIESAIFEWRAHKVPFGLLFMDIDLFKNVNDTYGHDMGDEVIRMVGTSATNVIRQVDAVARWGGEEFIAVLPGANHATLTSLAERMRSIVQTSFLMKGQAKIEVTVSIGGAIFGDEDTAATIVAKADAQMYLCKKSGRNRTLIL